MVHAVLAARAEVIVLTQNVKQQKQKKTEAKMIKKKKTGKKYLPTTEAQARAGEVFIRKEATVCYQLTCDFPTEALAQCLQGN